MSKSLITTHILDTAVGLPAEHVPVSLYKKEGDDWTLLDSAKTDADGRIAQWSVSDDQLPYGIYKLKFEISAYQGEEAFYPFAEICFKRSDDRHHHIPLLLTPFGYSTYRGS